MNNLIIALVAWWIAEGSNLVQSLKFWLAKKELWYINQKYLGGPKGEIVTYRKGPRRLKPFDCPMCLAFWFGFIFFSATHECGQNKFLELGWVLMHSIICSALAIFISKIFYRL